MIDLNFGRVGTCRKCKRDATVYPIALPDGEWSWLCQPCAKESLKP